MIDILTMDNERVVLNLDYVVCVHFYGDVAYLHMINDLEWRVRRDEGERVLLAVRNRRGEQYDVRAHR